MKDNNNNNKDTKITIEARRQLLKTAIGGTTLAAVALPSKWATPVLNTVFTPAHAQTSLGTITAGVYGTSSPIALYFGSDKKSNTEYALLDLLIAPAQAADLSGTSNHLITEICGTSDDDDDNADDEGDDERPTPLPGNSNIYIKVNNDLTVNIAIDEIDDDNGACANVGSVVSVLNGTSIPNVTIILDDDEYVELSGMTLTAPGEISGMYSVGGDEGVECAGAFTAYSGSTYPAGAVDCRDDD